MKDANIKFPRKGTYRYPSLPWTFASWPNTFLLLYSGRITDVQGKINVLIQCTLGQVEIKDWELKQEASKMITEGVRITRSHI